MKKKMMKIKIKKTMSNELKQLYEDKRILVEKSETLLKDVKTRSNKIVSAEERKTFDEMAKQIDDINGSIEFHKTYEKNALYDEVRKMEKPMLTDQEGFSLNSGRVLPVFNRSNKASVRSYYESSNPQNAELSKVGFGQLVRAKLFGAKNELEERALAEGIDSAGGYSVPEIISADFVDRMRPKSRLLQAGANLFTVDQRTDKFSWAKLETGITAEWKAENASQSAADPTFGTVAFEFKTLRALVLMSNELLQDSLNIDKMIEAEATRAFASEFDRVGLIGSGSGAEPQGISNYSNAVTVSMTTNGAAPASYDEVLALIMELQTENAEVDGTSPAIMHPRTLAAYNVLKSTADDQPIRRPDYISMMPFLHTTSVGIADTYGSASDASKLFLGEWNKLYFAQRLGVQIIPLNQRYAENNQTGFLIVARVDVKPTHENAFGYIKGLLGASIPS
ncbi:MAG: phage major capsid protein [Cyclobacteriaceae bacterium]|nr:phage major capsid protein [Cyclobacteriaceae bacterium]